MHAGMIPQAKIHGRRCGDASNEPEQLAAGSAIRRRGCAWRILGLALLALLGGCRQASQSPPDSPTILIGVDGFEWRLQNELRASGRLPTLDRLAKQGVAATLAVSRPTLSPIIWNSVATGVGPNRHGIRGFVHRAFDKEGPQLYTSHDRRAKALWNIASDAGRSSWTIGWWTTFPAERVRGIVVSQVNTITPKQRRLGRGIWKGSPVAGLQHQVYPEDLAPMIDRQLALAEGDADHVVAALFGDDIDRLPPAPRLLVEQSRWAFRADAAYFRIARELLSTRPAPDLLSIYFGGTDVVGHRFWRYTYPEEYRKTPSAEELSALGNAVRGYYEQVDKMIGQLLALAPANANVIVLSDHGMRPIRRKAAYDKPLLSGAHHSAPPAFFLASGPAIRAASFAPPAPAPAVRRKRRTRHPFSKSLVQRATAPPSFGTVLDVAPTVLTLLGLAVGEDMPGRVLSEILQPEFLRDHRPRTVASHTPADWHPPAPETDHDARNTAGRLDQLRALGYLE